MIYTSLAVLAMSASAALSPLSKLVHLHARSVQPDKRISLILHNDLLTFQDIAINGRNYTIYSHHQLLVKAPVGTIIFAASSTGQHKRGEQIVEITAQQNDQLIDLK
jgi:hypothetical protein